MSANGQLKLNELVQAVLDSSYSQEEIIAFIRDLEKRGLRQPLPVGAVEPPPTRRGRPRKYQTRDLVGEE